MKRMRSFLQYLILVVLAFAVTGQAREKGQSQPATSATPLTKQTQKARLVTPSPQATDGLEQKVENRKGQEVKQAKQKREKVERQNEKAQPRTQEEAKPQPAEQAVLQNLKKADQGIQEAVATLQSVLTDIPAHQANSNSKARKALQKTLNRLQADHARVMKAVTRAGAENRPKEERLEGTINPLLNSIEKSIADLKQRLAKEQFPLSTLSRVRSALEVLAQSRSLVLEARHHVRAEQGERSRLASPMSPK